jgi:hypothetical protein
MSRFLITRPRHDPIVTYLFHWNEEIIKLAESNNIPFSDFRDEKANRRNVEQFLEIQNPRLVVFNGHGNAETICGHNDEPIIKKNDNEKLLESKIVYAIACDAARELGENAVKSGCAAFVGYENVFGFAVDSTRIATPQKDKIAEPFKQFSNTIVKNLLEGHTSGESVEKAKRVASELIVRYSISTVEPGYAAIRFWLFWDRLFLKIIGNQTAKF